jgi:hypothetical protein
MAAIMLSRLVRVFTSVSPVQIRLQYRQKYASALSHFSFGVVDLAKGPPVLGSSARSTTSTAALYLDGSLVF